MSVELWNNELFVLGLEASPSGKLIINQQGIIKYVNSKILDIFNYPIDEILGQPIEALIPEEFRNSHPQFRESFNRNPAVREMGSGTVLYGLDSQGRKIPVEIGLNPLEYEGQKYVLASVADISERILAQQRFKISLEASPNGVLLIDQNAGIVLVNSRIEEIFGYGRDELINRSVSMLIPSSHREVHPGYIERFMKAPSARKMGTGRDLYGVHKNGREVPVEIGLNPIEIDGNLHVLASVVDISERKQAEHEREVLNKQIQHAQRMESLGVLAGAPHMISIISCSRSPVLPS